MSSQVLICGSVAFDTIAVFDGRFKDHILPDRIHALSVSFLVPSMRKEFGGCAGNIAYNLKLLGGQPLPVATVGQDASDYLERFERLDIPTQFIKVLPDMFTAQCFITTDLDDNQISAFHPWGQWSIQPTTTPRRKPLLGPLWRPILKRACWRMLIDYPRRAYPYF